MSITNGALQGKQVLVTGATGFIGGRLAMRLDREEGAVVTGCGRRVEPRPKVLEETGVILEKADLLDDARMAELVAGKEVVFHVAAWMPKGKSSDDSAAAVNIDGTEKLVRAAAKAGVGRFVQMSTVNAYGEPPDGSLRESDGVEPDQPDDPYGRTKAIGETRALALGAELGLEVTVLRPGMVYGPGSLSWTRTMLNLVRKGVPTLFGKGDGYAMPVYVDDLLDQTMLQAVKPEAVGEAFNSVWGPVPWTEFFGYYAEMCGKAPRRVPFGVAWTIAAANEVIGFGLPLNRSRLRITQRKPVYSMDKAKELLGFEPRVDMEEGMKRSEAWLREAGYL